VACYVLILLVLVSTGFLAFALHRIKKTIKLNREMQINQRVMNIHISMMVMKVVIDLGVFTYLNYIAMLKKPG
jgi:hypothetical protein